MNLSETLNRYLPKAGEESLLSEMRALYAGMGKFSCERACPTHFTASAFIVNERLNAAVLVRHNLLGRYVWAGGHNDGEEDCLAVALREAEEETGLSVRPYSSMPFMLNRFEVPAHEKNGQYVAAHTHFSLAYCLVAREEPPRAKEGENTEVIWVPFERLGEFWKEPELVERCILAVREEAEQKSHAFAAIPDLLLPWFYEHKRILPWRQMKNPYATWISEIMLQQTRVEAVKEYFLRFLRALPTVEDLATCDDEKLMKLWEGLGYYSRARNLKRAAEIVVKEYGGAIPPERERLAKLPGIGDYTAGAISSIAFGNPEPAVDGNVLRVISRITEDFTNIDLPACKAEMTERLRSIYPPDAGAFTESLMELGAIVCVPNGAPLCGECPMRPVCLAYRSCAHALLPVRKEKAARKKETMTVFFLISGQKIALRKRAQKDVLNGMWEFPNCPGSLTAKEAEQALFEQGIAAGGLQKRSHVHIFTHKEWHMTCYYGICDRLPEACAAFTAEEIRDKISLPSAFKWCLDECPAMNPATE